MHFLLFYEFVPDYLQRRSQYRNQHLRLAWESQMRGELVLGGPYLNPTDGAALLFSCESRTTVERFASADPYVLAGLVVRWQVREWTTVVGHDAATPVRPSI